MPADQTSQLTEMHASPFRPPQAELASRHHSVRAPQLHYLICIKKLSTKANSTMGSMDTARISSDLAESDHCLRCTSATLTLTPGVRKTDQIGRDRRDSGAWVDPDMARWLQHSSTNVPSVNRRRVDRDQDGSADHSVGCSSAQGRRSRWWLRSRPGWCQLCRTIER